MVRLAEHTFYFGMCVPLTSQAARLLMGKKPDPFVLSGKKRKKENERRLDRAESSRKKEKRSNLPAILASLCCFRAAYGLLFSLASFSPLLEDQRSSPRPLLLPSFFSGRFSLRAYLLQASSSPASSSPTTSFSL